MPRYYKDDAKMVYVKWMDRIQPGNYVAKTGDIDRATGNRSKILFFPANQMITKMRRGDFSLLTRRLRDKVRMLERSEVPEEVLKTFGDGPAVSRARQGKSAATKSATKKPPRRKAKGG